MKLLSGYLFLMFTTAPAISIVEAHTASTLWSWFAASELGSGPSVGAWFGIALIFTVAMNVALRNVQSSGPTDPDKVLSQGLLDIFGTTVGCGVVLGASYLVGIATGWV